MRPLNLAMARRLWNAMPLALRGFTPLFLGLGIRLSARHSLPDQFSLTPVRSPPLISTCRFHNRFMEQCVSAPHSIP